MRKCLLILFFAFAAAGASAAQIDTVAVFSAKMQREIPALVVVPDAGVGRRMPVLYLLHGFGGSYTTWQNITDLRPLADACGMIVVCPDGREQLVLGQSPRSGVAVRDLRGAGTARLDRRPLPDDSFARGPRRHGLEYGRSRRAVGSAAPQRPFRGCGIDLGRRGHPAFPRLVGDEETVGRTERQSGTLERAYGDPSGPFRSGTANWRSSSTAVIRISSIR